MKVTEFALNGSKNVFGYAYVVKCGSSVRVRSLILVMAHLRICIDYFSGAGGCEAE